VLCRHVSRLPDYLWVAEDGMKMQGYNGSQLWDTAFTAQAYVATNVDTPACIKSLQMAHDYIKNSQACSQLLPTMFCGPGNCPGRIGPNLLGI
jgi:squalene cyclase